MTQPPQSPEDRFSALVEALRGEPDVSVGPPTGKGFGSSALKAGGKIFAMLVRGRLVLKLPRRRVEALVAAGAGERFDPGHGRLMREWISLDSASGDDWLPLAREALAFVAARR